MSHESRQVLARQQEDLVRALKLGEKVPQGFKAESARLAGSSLLNKRARTVAKVWPRLAESLGAQFRSLFREYVAEQAPSVDGAMTDGRLFARWLNRRRKLPDSARIELAHFELRQGIPVRFFRLRESGGIALGFRVGKRTRVVRT